MELFLNESVSNDLKETIKGNIGDSLQLTISKVGNFKREYFKRDKQKHNIQVYSAEKGMIYMINSHFQRIEDSLDVENSRVRLVSKQKNSNEIILGLDCECYEYKGISDKSQKFTLNFCYSEDTPFIDYKLFEKHNDFFLNDFFETSHRPYLKYSFESEKYKFSYTATNIKEQQVNDLDIFREFIILNRENKKLLVANKKQGTILHKGEKINNIDQNFKMQGVWKLYDDNRDLEIVFNTKDSKIISDVEIFRDSKLAVLIHSFDSITIFENKKRIPVKIIKNKEGVEIFTSLDGNTLDNINTKLVHSMLELAPSYYGGYEALKTFVANNVDKQKIKNNKGNVTVSFAIDIDGCVTDYRIISGDNPFLKEEALRLLSIMPRWQPGLQRNHLVRSNHTLPLNF